MDSDFLMEGVKIGVNDILLHGGIDVGGRSFKRVVYLKFNQIMPVRCIS